MSHQASPGARALRCFNRERVGEFHLVFCVWTMLLALPSGCSVHSVSSSEPSRDVNSSDGFARGSVLLVGSGEMDLANIHVPAVMVSTTITDPRGNKTFRDLL
jgi:hypothetical protein